MKNLWKQPTSTTPQYIYFKPKEANRSTDPQIESIADALEVSTKSLDDLKKELKNQEFTIKTEHKGRKGRLRIRDNDGDIVGFVEKGHKVRFLGETKNINDTSGQPEGSSTDHTWFKVALPSGKEGWVSAEYLDNNELEAKITQNIDAGDNPTEDINTGDNSNTQPESTHAWDEDPFNPAERPANEKEWEAKKEAPEDINAGDNTNTQPESNPEDEKTVPTVRFTTPNGTTYSATKEGLSKKLDGHKISVINENKAEVTDGKYSVEFSLEGDWQANLEEALQTLKDDTSKWEIPDEFNLDKIKESNLENKEDETNPLKSMLNEAQFEAIKNNPRILTDILSLLQSGDLHYDPGLKSLQKNVGENGKGWDTIPPKDLVTTIENIQKQKSIDAFSKNILTLTNGEQKTLKGLSKEDLNTSLALLKQIKDIKIDGKVALKHVTDTGLTYIHGESTESKNKWEYSGQPDQESIFENKWLNPVSLQNHVTKITSWKEKLDAPKKELGIENQDQINVLRKKPDFIAIIKELQESGDLIVHSKDKNIQKVTTDDDGVKEGTMIRATDLIQTVENIQKQKSIDAFSKNILTLTNGEQKMLKGLSKEDLNTSLTLLKQIQEFKVNGEAALKSTDKGLTYLHGKSTENGYQIGYTNQESIVHNDHLNPKDLTNHLTKIKEWQEQNETNLTTQIKTVTDFLSPENLETPIPTMTEEDTANLRTYIKSGTTQPKITVGANPGSEETASLFDIDGNITNYYSTSEHIRRFLSTIKPKKEDRSEINS